MKIILAEIIFLLSIPFLFPLNKTLINAGLKKQMRKPIAWEAGIIPYQFSSEIDALGRKRIKFAMNKWEKATGVKFVPRKKELSHVFITAGDGCSSMIGKIGFRQEITLPEACQSQHTILHELGHALGLRHEHQRLQRDRFININWKEIEPNFQSFMNFIKMEDIESSKLPYDANSIMHYSSYSFSTGLPVIEDKKGNLVYRLYHSRSYLSTGDIQKIKWLYKEELK